MSPTELQAAREELALLKAERTRRLVKGRVVFAGNGAEIVSRQYGSYSDLVGRILELQAEIRAADPRALGALHIR